MRHSLRLRNGKLKSCKELKNAIEDIDLSYNKLESCQGLENVAYGLRLEGNNLINDKDILLKFAFCSDLPRP